MGGAGGGAAFANLVRVCDSLSAAALAGLQGLPGMGLPLAPGMAPAMPGLLGPPPGAAPPGAPPFSVPPPGAAGAAAVGAAGATTPSGLPGLMTTSPFGGASGSDKLELARRLALKINAQKQLSSNAAAIAAAAGAPGAVGGVRPVGADGIGLMNRPGQPPVLTVRGWEEGRGWEDGRRSVG